MNKILTTFILGNEDLFIKDIRDEVEIIRFNKLEDIFNARGSYISFVDSEDNISDDYFSRILDKIKFNEFDSCFINYRINYDYVRELKVRTDEYDLNSKVPKKNSYIWNFVFNKNKLIELIRNNFNGFNDIFVNRTNISNIFS